MVTRAAFERHVAVIVCVRPDKQMIWIHTDRIVAAVKDVKKRGYSAVGAFVGKTVGIDDFAAFQRELTITSR